MIIVTGGAGFIGSNIVRELNERGRDDVVVVDDLTNGKQFVNLADCTLHDYFDKDDFLDKLKNDTEFDAPIEAIFHEGACSVTTEWDGRYMLDNNFEYSKVVLEYCIRHKIPFIYASSAATYGGNQTFQEHPDFEAPLNVYGYSKLLFDQYVRRRMPEAESQIVGLRYFNVYGPRESHKGSMASVAFHLNNQLVESGEVKLFAGCEGYGDGEQSRDFVYVGDVVKVNLWLQENPHVSGIFNVGTGRSQPFNDIAEGVLAYHKRGELKYIPFPGHLKGCYQSFTQADINKLREAGYQEPFKSVQEGVAEYMAWLNR